MKDSKDAHCTGRTTNIGRVILGNKQGQCPSNCTTRVIGMKEVDIVHLAALYREWIPGTDCDLRITLSHDTGSQCTQVRRKARRGWIREPRRMRDGAALHKDSRDGMGDDAEGQSPREDSMR